MVLARTADGRRVLLSPVNPQAEVEVAEDGLARLRRGRPVTNDEVLGAIDAERATR